MRTGVIKSDLYRYAGNVSLRSLVYQYFYNRSFRYCFWLRLAMGTGVLGILAKVRLKLLMWSSGIDIPPGTQIGAGLYLAHGQSIVVNPTAIIGRNCCISQFVTIGANDGPAATIGDDVYIGPSVCIVENVRIGNRATIGAGAVVTRDVPDDATVVGVPARVVNFDNPGRYIKNRWLER